MVNLANLTVSKPPLTDELFAFFHENLNSHLFIEEMVAIVIFTEYLCLDEDKDIFKGAYLDSVFKRFARYNTGSLSHPELYAHALNYGVPLKVHPTALQRAEKTYMLESAIVDAGFDPLVRSEVNDVLMAIGGVQELDRYRKATQSKYLYMCETTNKLFDYIVCFYKATHSQVLDTLRGRFAGGAPRVINTIGSNIELHIPYIDDLGFGGY